MKRPQIITDYLYKIYGIENFPRTINKAVKVLKKFHRKTPFEAIAFTGFSGAAIAFPLSYLLKKPLICIRRYRDGSHFGSYGRVLEGCVNAKTYIFVDDCIVSGKTARRVFARITKTKAKCVGIYLYDDRLAKRTEFNDVPIMGLKCLK